MTDDGSDDMTRRDTASARAPRAVVGIGASAGGIEAMRAFFANVAPDSGLAYVVILHLSPEYESRLAEVLQTAAKVPVTQVEDEVTLEANHVYVISPNQTLRVEHGELLARPIVGPEERRAPVDMFFRTLATAYGPSAIAVVLSGTGPNGSNGIKRIKEVGGLTLAQAPDDAEFGDMPKNSIATGLVDQVLRAAEMPGRIVQYVGRLPGVAGPGLETEDRAEDDVRSNTHARAAQDWRDVLTLLRLRTGHDFSNYKGATLRRRVERRLNVRGLSSLAEYAELMRGDPNEPFMLMRELLISVTQFFRDPEAFTLLEQRVVPLLFDRKSAGDQVRVWCAGCATGEEAYSLAMLMAEHAATLPSAVPVQVFATDLDEQAVAIAREGLYSEADVADIARERLQRFFHREPGGYRVRRELRELVLFAHHNVIKDPPFSHLDLIACRNVLIYLNRPVQERLVETFHFALRPGGVLFLGTSEVADSVDDLFQWMDKTAHIFESRSAMSRPSLPQLVERTLPPALALPRLPESRPQADRIQPGELHQRLLEQFAPPSVVVNEEYTLLHVSHRAGDFLQLSGGEPSRDILKIIHPDLRSDLRTALHLGARERSMVAIRSARVRVADVERMIRIVVKPVLRDGTPPRGYFLVLFENDEAPPVPAEASALHLTSPAESESRQLTEELTRVKGQLRATIEQYETHNEEARAANEELQAMNEELRSSMEELETSKEELQSVNEELTTVNQELKIKIEELGFTNNDFQNLINASNSATIFLDRSLHVKRSTPRAHDVFNLLPTDIGRKLSDITTRLLHDTLHDDLRQVLDRLETIEREVQTREGHWYLMRVLPYRTIDDRIDGVALTFHDITARREAELRLHSAEERFRLLIDSLVDYAIFTVTDDGRIDSWNPGAQRMFGFVAAEVVGQPARMLFTPEDRSTGVPEQELAAAREQGCANDERWNVRKDGSRFLLRGVTTRVADGRSFVKIARDLTEPQRAAAALQHAHDGLEDRVRERTGELRSEIERNAVTREHFVALLRRLVSAQEDERARIARDLHDELGQQLTALRLALEQHREHCESTAQMDEAQRLVQTVDREIDFLAWELRPAVLDDLGLTAALPRYLREWSKHSGIGANFTGSGPAPGQLSPAAETAFYRVAQEALNNISKHSQATRVDVILDRRDNLVVLVVEDDGIGFDPANRDLVDRGIGLAGMRQRAALANATLQVESSPGKGTTVFLRCPADQAESAET